MNEDSSSTPNRTVQDTNDGAPTERTEEGGNPPPRTSPTSDSPRHRRRFLQVASTAGVAALAGCLFSADGDGIYWGGDDEADGSEPVQEETDTPEPTPEETNTPKPTAEQYEVHSFELTSHDGDVDVYGTIKMRGVYDEDEYINPRGRTNWEAWKANEDEYLSLEEGTPQEVFVPDSTIVFPTEAIENLDESEPFTIVRVDIIWRRESADNEFLGWDSVRVYVDELDGQTEGEDVTLQFTGGGNDVRISFTVSPVYS